MPIVLHTGKPFKDLFILSIAFLALALWATLDSLGKDVTALLFLPFDFLFLLTMTRSYQLMLMYERRGVKDEPRIRDLSLSERALIYVDFIALFVLIGFAIYFLGWIV
jgi:hypothetical protein